MKKYRILHRTYYNFHEIVVLGKHELRLRPREGHDLVIEQANLEITPSANLIWYRDIEDNSVAIASFNNPTNQLVITSEIILKQYNIEPLNFLIDEYAVNYPFNYYLEDKVVLLPYIKNSVTASNTLIDWINSIWQPSEQTQSFSLSQRICQHIHQTCDYQIREEPGVQTPEQTLLGGTGACRDFAFLMMEAVRYLGFASRFVSGYLHAPPSNNNFGATHAWVEIYIPGAGWIGFDPTLGEVTGDKHFAVAVAGKPDILPPIAGTFIGLPNSTFEVGVWVTEL